MDPRVNMPALGILEPSMLVGGTMMMALSVYWDAWWHEAYGRDSFWIPPHLGIYAGLFISLGGFLLLYKLQRRKISRALWIYAVGVAALVASGYADEQWHRIYGVEKVGTLATIWSPTHVAALLSGIVAALGIISYLSILSKTDARLGWLLAAEFGVLVSIVTLLLLPLGPETPFRLIGIWGAAPVAFVILAMRFFGSVLSEKPWALSVITAFNWTGNAILLSNHASLLVLGALVVVGLTPPFFADLIIQRGRRMKNVRNAYALAGVEWGIIFGTFFYLLTNSLSFQGGYTPWDVASLGIIGTTTTVTSTLAGFFAGSKSQQRMLARTLLVTKTEVPAGARL